MIFQLGPRSANSSGIATDQADATYIGASTGNSKLFRAKRDGRNPSTGARTSRKFWSSYYWNEGILPLTQGNENFIY